MKRFILTLYHGCIFFKTLIFLKIRQCSCRAPGLITVTVRGLARDWDCQSQSCGEGCSVFYCPPMVAVTDSEMKCKDRERERGRGEWVENERMSCPLTSFLVNSFKCEAELAPLLQILLHFTLHSKKICVFLFFFLYEYTHTHPHTCTFFFPVCACKTRPRWLLHNGRLGRPLMGLSDWFQAWLPLIDSPQEALGNS